MLTLTDAVGIITVKQVGLAYRHVTTGRDDNTERNIEVAFGIAYAGYILKSVWHDLVECKSLKKGMLQKV